MAEGCPQRTERNYFGKTENRVEMIDGNRWKEGRGKGYRVGETSTQTFSKLLLKIFTDGRRYRTPVSDDPHL